MNELDTLQRLAGLEVEVKHIKETTDKVDDKTDRISDKLDALIANFPTRQELNAELKSRDEAITTIWEELQDFKREIYEKEQQKKTLIPNWVGVLISLAALLYAVIKN